MTIGIALTLPESLDELAPHFFLVKDEINKQIDLGSYGSAVKELIIGLDLASATEKEEARLADFRYLEGDHVFSDEDDGFTYAVRDMLEIGYLIPCAGGGLDVMGRISELLADAAGHEQIAEGGVFHDFAIARLLRDISAIFGGYMANRQA